jgi:Sec-independent protein translocase protein TatA
MSQRGSAMLWLVMALVFGVVSLAGCGGAGYGIWHVQTRLDEIKNQKEKDEELRKDRKQEEEALKRLANADKEESDYIKYRWFSIAGAIGASIPAVMTLAFLLMAMTKFMKKPKPPIDDEDDDEDEEDEDEDDEEEEEDDKPARKKRRVDDDDE